jgi:Dolichyl-phosphate-mannose-protein mannosyltransferase
MADAASQPAHGEPAGPATGLLLGIAAVKLLIQFAGINHYGFFRDELYYIACGQHLAWGYVDQPPLIALIAWIARHLLGDSLFGTRLLPVMAGAAVVALTGALAHELGGGRYAQGLAAAAALFAPAFLAFDSFLSMNAFEPLFWIACAWIVMRIVNGGPERLWVWFGVLAGVGLENKHTMAVFGFALVAALVLSGRAGMLRSKWIWIGGALALAIFAPNLIWEARHGWPQIEVVRNAQLYKNEPIGPLEFLWDQVLFLHPVALPIWVAGLVWFLAGREGKRWRFFGYAYFIVLAIFMVLQGKSYYVLPVYPLLMAGGGVALEGWLGAQKAAPWRKWLAVALPAVLVIGGVLTVPFGAPVLPVNQFLRYARAMPYAKSVKTERDATAELPQLYADMFGWDTMAEEIAKIYHSLPVAEQPGCAILAGNYGEAGAIDYYGPNLGLPKAISGHNNYFLWGPREYSGACVIVFGERAPVFKDFFEEAHLVAVISSWHAMPVEQNVPVYVCRRSKEPLAALWPQFKLII